MFYKLLGMAVWHGGKFALRRKYGATYVPKPVLAAVAAVGVVGAVVAILAARRNTAE